MNESLLEALLQLFAIVAEVEGINDKSRETVRAFLTEELNTSQIDEYLTRYDAFVQKHHFRKSKVDGRVKQTSRNAVKILRIATEINQRLTKQQKMLVIFRLVEYIYEQNILTDQNLEFLDAIIDSFNVERDEFELIKRFIAFDLKSEVKEGLPLLLVTGRQEVTKPKFYHQGVDGVLPFVWLNKSRILAFRKLTNQELSLSGQQIKPNRTYFFRQGASIKSSRIQALYYSDILGQFTRENIEAPILFQVDQIEYRFKKGNVGLHPLSFEAKSGEIVGIMGGSGTGKSTLMNVLNGNYMPTSGSVEINGVNLYDHGGGLDGLIGYVPQDDLLIEQLTVFENLFFNARLSFGTLSRTETIEKVDGILTSLGLSEARDLKVGSPLEKTISGGQRKRLNIALELIREPAVLFLDEPTSGLSSRDSENIMDLLNEMTLNGKVIFVVIHQPSSEIFKMFDKLLILDKGGFIVYQGNPLDGISYFQQAEDVLVGNSSDCPSCGNVNPEQIFDIIETKLVDEYGDLTLQRKRQPEDWHDLYQKRIGGELMLQKSESKIPKIDFKLPNWFRQFGVFITRDVKSKVASMQYILVNLLEAPVLALIVAGFLRYYADSEVYGSSYVFRNNDNILAYLFISVVVALFMGLSVSAEEIIRDLRIRKRESFLNLSRSGYLGSKIVLLFVLSAIQVASYVWVGNTLLGIEDLSFQYWLILWTTSCFANMLGLNISASFKNVVTIYILIPFVIIPQILFSGVLVKYENLNPWLTSQKYVPIIGDLMASRWAFEALAVNQALNNRFEKHYERVNQKVYHYSYKKNYWIPEMEAAIGFISISVGDPERTDQVIASTKFMYREFSQLPEVELQHFNGNLKALARGILQVNSINRIREFLVLLEGHYIRQLNKYVSQKDEITSKLKDKLGGERAYRDFKFKYENERLLTYLNNRNSITKIVEIGGTLVRKENKLYEFPKGYRTHYYAPKKYFVGSYYPTVHYNVVVLWAASILLMVSLYFGWFPRLIAFLGRIW